MTNRPATTKIIKQFAAIAAGTGMLALLFLAACRPPAEEYAKVLQVHYLNNEGTGLLTREYRTNTTETKELVAELISELSRIPDKLEYISPLAKGFALLEYDISGGQVTLSFEDQYLMQPVTTEVLVRAALVRTLTQLNGIDYVSIMIRSEPLMDSMGNLVGVMSADMFIDNVGNEINTLEKTNLRLYFGNENGGGLTPVTRSGVVYDSNTAIAKVVVESLIDGPLTDEAVQATINPETNVVNITVQDGICYVNLDDRFLNQLDQVSAEMTIYSITNSLVELPDIYRVQILVNGSTGVIFRENINLDTIFERNLDIVS